MYVTIIISFFVLCSCCVLGHTQLEKLFVKLGWQMQDDLWVAQTDLILVYDQSARVITSLHM